MDQGESTTEGIMSWSEKGGNKLTKPPFGIREVTGIEGASIHGRAGHRRCLLWEMQVVGL
jgi:hypothetical protein